MPLFDVLPPDLFKPLAAPAKRLYSDLLLHIFHETFEPSAEAPRRVDVLRAIETFLAARNDDEPDMPAGRPEERARAVSTRRS